MAKAPAPPAALFTRGIPSRVHMPAQMASDIARLLDLGKNALERSDRTRADSLAAALHRLLRPRCGYGYRYKRFDGCSMEVRTPGERCTEHDEWPLPNGVDPDPDRCPGTPLDENGTATWAAEGARIRLFGTELETETSAAIVAMRCPYPRRPDGSPCPLHDPQPEDQCGWTDTAETEPCTEITALYGCPKHHAKKLAKETAKIRHSAPCTHCKAEQGHPCTGRPEPYNDHVHAPRKHKTDPQVETLHRSMPAPPGTKQAWAMASHSIDSMTTTL